MITRAYSRCDLLLTLAAISLLLVTGVAMVPREVAKRAACANNLRQLGVAVFSYADEHENTFPPRQLPAWPTQLYSHYGDTKILLCPADGPQSASNSALTNADRSPRSYIINGWNDYFWANTLNPYSPTPMPVAAVPEPGQTIVFGEKENASLDFSLDLFDEGCDVAQVDKGRHFKSDRDLQSNYTFADGSVRSLRYSESYIPLLLWAINPDLRIISWYSP